jgi:MoxR-like ATPase
MNDDTELAYTPLFDPGPVHIPAPLEKAEAGDQRRRPPYVYTPEVTLAVNVALATRRPLLVKGESGAGKSSLAPNAADLLGRRYYEYVVTSRTEASHLLWEVDLLRRLHDAQRKQGELGEDYTPYIEPGPLWWAFDPQSAACRGASADSGVCLALADPAGQTGRARAVVLIDEIDKADPDVPNNLLVPLGSLQFQVKETGARVATDPEHAPLVIITTNGERELPPAFLRRCIEVEVKLPSRARLKDIAATHFPKLKADYIAAFMDALLGPAMQPEGDAAGAGISPAEFIDALRACDELKVKVGDATWRHLTQITVWKHGRKPPRRS